MLKQLTIQNYALIERTELDLAEGMSVITGETGAGKSIMLGALGLLLGQKTDIQVLQDKEKKCVVEATFDIAPYALQHLFEDADIDYSDETVIRREILPSGKSRSFVNETPANVAFLKELGAKLIDIHSQHQNMLLSQSSFHLDVVDSMAKTSKEQEAYSQAYSAMKSIEKELDELKALNASQSKELDYDRHQLRELENAKLSDPDELETLERQQEAQDKAEDIKQSVATAVKALDTEDSGILSQLSEAVRNIDHIAQFLPTDSDIPSRLESARIDLEDICHSLQDFSENVEFDADELERLTNRLNTLNSLTQKHSVNTVAELISIRDNLAKKVASVDNFDEQLSELSAKLETAKAEAQKLADTLTEERKSVFDAITNYVATQLREMGMANAKFVVSHKVVQLCPTGQDEIRFLFSANKNGEPTDIARVASGGEMSRVMLSIKSLLSKTKNLPTIIFDEIDTGVSGDVASKMGRIMNEMAKHIQVLAITHLPQVAACGERQYRVYKEDTPDRTISHIALLTPDERITEIAKMLSGAQLTDTAIANAKELLKNAK